MPPKGGLRHKQPSGAAEKPSDLVAKGSSIVLNVSSPGNSTDEEQEGGGGAARSSSAAAASSPPRGGRRTRGRPQGTGVNGGAERGPVAQVVNQEDDGEEAPPLVPAPPAQEAREEEEPQSWLSPAGVKRLVRNAFAGFGFQRNQEPAVNGGGGGQARQPQQQEEEPPQVEVEGTAGQSNHGIV